MTWSRVHQRTPAASAFTAPQARKLGSFASLRVLRRSLVFATSTSLNCTADAASPKPPLPSSPHRAPPPCLKHLRRQRLINRDATASTRTSDSRHSLRPNGRWRNVTLESRPARPLCADYFSLRAIASASRYWRRNRSPNSVARRTSSTLLLALRTARIRPLT